MDDVLLEVCLEDPHAVRVAEAGGARRIELCSSLSVGGLAPGADAMRTARECTRLPIVAMVRARAGDFCCGRAERRVMEGQIEAARRAGMDGLVLGCLARGGRIDRPLLAELSSRADGLPLTFHRAFDHTPDADDALETLVELGVARVLSSGRAPTAREGADELARLVRRAGGRIEVVVGGGVRAAHAARLRGRTGALAFHSSVSGDAPLTSEAVARLLRGLRTPG